jgi:hypothetical protein
LSDGEAEIDMALAPNGVTVDYRSASVSAPPDRMPSNEAEHMRCSDSLNAIFFDVKLSERREFMSRRQVRELAGELVVAA